MDVYKTLKTRILYVKQSSETSLVDYGCFSIRTNDAFHTNILKHRFLYVMDVFRASLYRKYLMSNTLR